MYFGFGGRGKLHRCSLPTVNRIYSLGSEQMAHTEKQPHSETACATANGSPCHSGRGTHSHHPCASGETKPNQNPQCNRLGGWAEARERVPQPVPGRLRCPAGSAWAPDRAATRAAHLRVVVEVPEVQAPHPVDAGEERGVHGGPHDVVHVVRVVFKGVEWLVVLQRGDTVKTPWRCRRPRAVWGA